MSGCGCIYSGGINYSTVISRKTPTARIAHKCNECVNPIKPGDVYERFVGADYEVAFTKKTCLDCVSVRTEFFCDGYFFGSIWEDVAEHIGAVDGEISSECLLRLTPRARGRIIDLIDEWFKANPDKDND